MTILQNKMRSRASSLQDQSVEDIDTANGYFEEESEELKELGSAKVINFIKKRKVFVISFLLIAAFGYGVYDKYFNLTDAEIAQKELSVAVATVGELMILPEGDEPVLANVTDAEALIKQQAFFAGAINGDQLLLFPKNMKAIIYSPSRNKIINAGPIEQQSQNQESRIKNQELGIKEVGLPEGSPTSQALRVAFYNGTKTVGLANEMESKLKSVSSDFETVAKINAESKDYKETIVIDLTGGTKSAEAQSIALALGVKVGELPSGETIPDADILVIAGGGQ